MAKARGTALPDYIQNEWRGLNTFTKSAKDLPKGYSPDSLNWITGWDVNSKSADHIELRRGMALLGDRKTGSGSVTGLGVGLQENGTQVPFWGADTGNVYYYNSTTKINTSVLTLPTAAKSDFLSIEPFNGLGGNFIYISSFNSSLYRIPVANPTSYIDCNSGQTPSGQIHGFLNFINSRMNLWQKNGGLNTSINKTDYFLSQIDFQTYAPANSQSAATSLQLAVYPQNGAAETIGTGDGTTKVFTHTLTHQGKGSVANILAVGATANTTTITGATAANPCVLTVSDASGLSVGQYILIEGVTGSMGTSYLNDSISQITAISGTSVTIATDTTGGTYSSGGTVYTVEYFTDDKNGILSSNLGGTGTVNYGTGALSFTFNTAPLNGVKIVCQFYYWLPLSGVEKIATDGTIGASTAYLWPQRDGGGDLECIQPFGNQNYCFHQYRTWVEYTDPNAATSSTNLPYRNLIGAPFYKAAWGMGDGVLFIDTSVPSHPKFSVLALTPIGLSSVVVPKDIGQEIDFSQYAFDYAVVFLFDVYYVLCCQSYVNGIKRTFNDTMFVFDSRSGYWSKLDYLASQLAIYNGTLLGGVSVSPNVFTLFSGFDDDGSIINNFWTSHIIDLEFKGLKTTGRMSIEGLIQPSQSFDIYVSYDQGAFSKVQTITGLDASVSKGNPQLVGNNTLGTQNIGAGVVYANPFVLDFQLASPQYQYIQIKFVATGIGYLEIDQFALKVNQMKSLAIQAVNTI